MRNIYDVIISGAGPTGALLGYLLSKSNIKTMIIEKEIFPRSKICAGGVQHRILDLIPFKIDSVIEKTISGIYFSYKNMDIFFKRYDNPIIYTVDRRRFDNFLAEKAIRYGSEINFGERIIGYESSGNHVEVITDKKKYNTKILVGADGANGPVHKSLIGGNSINKILGYIIELPYRKSKKINKNTERSLKDKYIISDKNNNNFDLNNSIRLDFNPRSKSYCWVFPKKEFFSAGIGALYRNAGFIKKYFNDFLIDLYSFNRPGIEAGKIMAHSIPLRQSNTPIKDYRVIAIGDAACLADSFTGEGLYNGFKSSIIAYDSIKSALKNSSFGFDDYDQKIKEEIFTDISLSARITKIFYSYSLFFYKLIKKNDNYFNACCKLLRGEKTYGDAFRKLKSFSLKK